MNMIEVDPQLFIKCRLCLEDMGLYQIVPSIQLQIKYCFDIDVEPYDGLPQLLCKKCENILSEYYTRKKIYLEKQKSLKKLPQKKMEKTVHSVEQPQQEAVSSSQPTENEIDSSQKEKEKESRKENVETKSDEENVETKSEENVEAKSLKEFSKDKVASEQTSCCQTNSEIEKKNKQITSSHNITDRDQFTSEQTAPLKTTIKIISKNIETKGLSAFLNEKKSNSNNLQETIPSSWKNDYIKQYICRICEIQLRKKHSIKKHVATHDPWLQDYRDIFKAHCTVVMKKEDNKPNITQLAKTVAYSNDRIIFDEGNPQYYVNYVSKSSCENNSTKNNIESKRKIKKNSYYDSSDDDVVVRRKQRKRRRLLSKSSNETVVLEDNNGKSPVTGDKAQNWLNSKSGKIKTTETECINIDDTSTDSSSFKNNSNKENKTDKHKEPFETNTSDYKTIQNIISMCHSKYLKRFEFSDSDTNKKSLKHSSNTDSQLKHKVLSLGRKVINKQGFNSTGLLRYLEFKNLEIHWIPTLNVNISKESNYVRIMTKLRGSEENSNELGWKKVSESLIDKEVTDEKSNETLYDSNLFVNADSDTVEEKSPILQAKKHNTDENLSRDNKVPDNTVSPSNICNDSESVLKNKLLNANPVPNPKHFPKKTNMIEMKPLFTKATTEVTPPQNDQNITSMAGEETMFIDLDEENSDNQMPMPIITSTTSLAPKKEVKEGYSHDETTDLNTVLPAAATENLDPKNQETNQEKPMSWLKVKPVSELMSERVLNNLNQQTNQPVLPNQALASNSVWSMGHSQVPFESNSAQLQNAGQPIYVRYTNSNMSENTTHPAPVILNREHVVLDSVDLPNTRTDSPFNYFKNLLQIHGIVLLDMNEVLTREFNCLIKFKLVFHQELKQQAPVVLCLSLFCEKNKFCLKVKDPSQEDVDVTKISANWQWEMLKAYKADVVPKLLQNAQRISQEVFEYTKSFLCLLKSIKLKSSS